MKFSPLKSLTDRRLIYAAAFLRALAIGLLGVLFALTLAARGLRAGEIGALVAVGIAGSACGTFFVGFWADSFGRRNTLLLLSALSVLGAILLLIFHSFAVLMAACFIGMVNAMGRERGAFFTLEQAILPESVADAGRTHSLAWYNVMIDAGQATGALLGGLPFLLRRHWAVPDAQSYQTLWWIYLVFALGCLLIYTRLSSAVETHGPTPWHQVSKQSRGIITRLSLLFGFDSLAGGFLPSSLIAYWFFKRFGVGEELAAPLFFFSHIANAVSYLVAVRLAKRIGLVKTMVFTHIPGNLCLMAIPFAPTLPFAALLYFLRECLVEMDVPTRQSYVMAVVAPGERTMAAGITNMTRLCAWTVAPTLAGLALQSAAMSVPMVLGGGMKIVYDGMLFYSFRHLKPPEEQ